ncbi:MAG: hypothetical protein JWO72_101 [Caulobacteraceae bacterium]|nr:hypothetical protein [Caulobacteraceae bacterium]
MEFWKYRRKPVAVETAQVDGPPDRRDAFEEGRRQGRLDERRRHHGHPLLKLAVVVVAVAGAAVLALAAHEGSFSRGGAVVDRNLAVAADNAQVSGAQAVAQAGQAVKDAGTSLEKKVTDATASKH